MKRFLVVLFLLHNFFSTNHAMADVEACTVVLCLSTGSMPAECVPHVENYLAQFAEHPWDAPAYLATCDMGTSPNVPNTRVIAQAYGHCNAASVNSATQYVVDSGETRVVYHRSVLPQYCLDYAEMIQRNGSSLSLPHFVPPPPVMRRKCGTCPLIQVSQPLEMGYWVD